MKKLKDFNIMFLNIILVIKPNINTFLSTYIYNYVLCVNLNIWRIIKPPTCKAGAIPNELIPHRKYFII